MKDGNDHIVIFGAGLDALLGDGIDRKYKRMLKSKKDIILTVKTLARLIIR